MSKSEAYEQLRKYKINGASYRQLFLLMLGVFYIIFNFDTIKNEWFHKYDIYTSLTFQQLIEEGYDEDDTLLNSMTCHNELRQYCENKQHVIDYEQLLALKDRKSRPLQASSILDFSNNGYFYRIEIIHERGLISNKNILISWSNEDVFTTNYEILDYILNKLNFDIESHEIENMFNYEYKKTWKDYNKSLRDINIVMDNIDNKYVCFIGNERNTHKIEEIINNFVYR